MKKYLSFLLVLALLALIGGISLAMCLIAA